MNSNYTKKGEIRFMIDRINNCSKNYILIAKVLILYFIIVSICISCNNSNNQEIKISLLPNTKRLKSIQSIIEDITYIPLETSHKCNIRNINKYTFIDNKILINNKNKVIYCFGYNGKFL